jgi:hypothetical protein
LITVNAATYGAAAGGFVLDVQGRTLKAVRAKPQPFTVVSKQIIRVDMDIGTDHWRTKSTQSFQPD